jgi:hypothetical protein
MREKSETPEVRSFRGLSLDFQGDDDNFPAQGQRWQGGDDQGSNENATSSVSKVSTIE